MNSRKDLIEKYFTQLISHIADINYSEIEKLVDLVLRTNEQNGTVFIVGNGGSAATASHFATDLGVGSLKSNKQIRAVSLTESSSNITAISNDFDYSEIFTQQLKLLGRKSDLLIAISASGNSRNLLKVVELADNMGLESYSLTGFNGGELQVITHGRNLHVETPIGAYGLVEDIHLSICHVITECIRSIFNE